MSLFWNPPEDTGLSHPPLLSQYHAVGWEAEQQGLKLAPVWDADTTGAGIAC